MTCTLVLLAALAQPAPAPATSDGLPPQQALAVIDGAGTLKITQLSSGGFGPASQETTIDVTETKGTEKVPAKATLKLTTVMLTTIEFPAKYVEAYSVEGTPIAREKLTEILAKERTVLVAMDGKKVDAFHLQLYKEGTIVLVPPAKALGAAAQGIFPVPGAAPLEPLPGPLDRPKPIEEKKPEVRLPLNRRLL